MGEIRVYCGETLTPRSGLAFASDSEQNASLEIFIEVLLTTTLSEIVTNNYFFIGII